ncbi:MAG: transporter substrate-binding domain-containing protein [Anaerolineales bacterium]|nr:transporter substrate-binding domain-containing protein [Anaerolineales bacterium]
MKKLFVLFSLLVMTALVLTACGGGATADNLLDEIKNRGYILISTDPNYEPQSFLNTESKRLADTKCPKDALTTAEMQGFDVDVAKAIADSIGVETCFATPAWDAITAGNWANKWDLSVGSMTITVDRQKILNFSVPYYYTPAVVAVGKDTGYTSLDELAGMNLCAGTSTTYEPWINNDMTALGLPESSIYAKAPAGVKAVTLETDQECAQAIAAGRKDFVGYVTSETVVDANIAAGMPVVKLGAPVFSEDLATAVDKSATLNADTLLKAVDAAIIAMHSDGTLTALSNQWFEMDLTQAPK